MQDYRSKGTVTGGYYSSSSPLPYGAGSGGGGTPQWMGNSQSMGERMIMSQPFKPSWQFPTSGVPAMKYKPPYRPTGAPSPMQAAKPFWDIIKDLFGDYPTADPWGNVTRDAPAGYRLNFSCSSYTGVCSGSLCANQWMAATNPTIFASCAGCNFTLTTACYATVEAAVAAFGSAPAHLIEVNAKSISTGRYKNWYRQVITGINPVSRPWNTVAPLPDDAPVSVPDPHPLPNVISNEGPGPQGSLPPYSYPSDDIVITPGGEPPIVIIPGSHDQVPDNSTKFKLDAGFIGALYGAVTEIDDFIEAWAKAIPGNPCRGMALHKQIACVMAHLDEVNIKQALFNMIVNELQDRAIGKAGSLADQLTKNPNWIRPYGTTAGSWAAPQTPEEFASQAPEWQQTVDNWVDGLMQ